MQLGLKTRLFHILSDFIYYCYYFFLVWVLRRLLWISKGVRNLRLGREEDVEMWRDVVRVASPSWNMGLRRGEQHQFYMELTPLLFYLGAMVLRQAKCNSACSSETVALVQVFLENISTLELYDSKLYTPSLSNYGRLQGVVFSLQQNCSRSTLKCFQKEMTVLVRETEQTSPLPRRLDSLTRQLSDKMHPCPQCEVFKEEKAEQFLKTLHTILQIMCSIDNTMTKSESNR